ncbi:alpha-(1,6)-fucosyltransferase-like [Penaeus chinensis]|uniref:alpha-(1,6)-fucosyltransferase-like n=1 Tax=Penaeus chinensis TaxID=139456 RepID=UPI001FB6D251|nr:alpha-(1,6)-fucosyltransferase-like [Penaeus chinensis]
MSMPVHQETVYRFFFWEFFILLLLLLFIPTSVIRPSGSGNVTSLRPRGDEGKSGRHADATAEQAQKFGFTDTTKTKETYTGPKFHEKTEALLRQVENDVYYTREFVLAQFRRLQHQLASDAAREDFAHVIKDVKHYFGVTQYDLWRLRNESGLHAWQKNEVEELSNLIQNRIYALQHPADCESAKKIVCNLPAWPEGRGIGSHLHHISYCFLASYGTQRTLIINEKPTNMDFSTGTYFLPLSENCTYNNMSTAWPGKQDSLAIQFPDNDKPKPRPNYFPRSVPRDFAQRLTSAHGDPFAWWMGQFFKYALRMTQGFQDYVEKLGARLGYESPIVGVQVRRTDKLRHDSRFIKLEEYMEVVDDFFDDLEIRGTKVTTRRIYLATDDPKVLQEAKAKFPNYAFVFNEESVATASLRRRSSKANMRNLMADIYFLSRSDFLVCGMSSNICRLAYELMQTLHSDASWKLFSMDLHYCFHYQSAHEVVARYPHSPRSGSEIELRKGDRVMKSQYHYNKQRNYHDGFSHGVNQRTKRAGLYPTYKTVDVLKLADTPPFDRMDNREE